MVNTVIFSDIIILKNISKDMHLSTANILFKQNEYAELHVIFTNISDKK